MYANSALHILDKSIFLVAEKRIVFNHEFIADEKSVNENNAASFAQMLLTTNYGKFEFLPAQSIFYSSIKRRLVMLTTSKKIQFSYLRRIMVLPLIAAVVCLFAFTVKDQNKNYSVQKITAAKPFVLVVDAGHGSKDNGAFSDGLYEKNLTLQIAEKIKELSSQYNIDVILTRDDDVFMSPPEKVNFTNAQDADAFISVHVNSSPKNQPPKSGMEVLLSKRNPDVLDNSKVLGSAIIQNLQKDFTIETALLQQNTGVWVLDQSKVPSVLIECGYITDANDIKILKNNEKIELMARNILQGVAMYANDKVDKNNLYQIKSAAVKDTNLPIHITLDKQPDTTNFKPPLYVLDGKIIPESDIKNGLINPNDISSINVLKDKSAIDKYGDAGKNGVVEITSKANKNAPINSDADTSTKPVFTSAQKEPQFPGGIDGWQKFLEANLNANVPAKKHAPKGIYTVTLSFLIDENGKVSNIEALTDPGYGTADEAKRVIAKGPDWIPAIQNGHKVTFQEKQNISFSVN